MKSINYLMVPLAFVSFNAVASQSLPAKQVNLPFYDEAILSKEHTGLKFNYDMNGNPQEKIVCKLSHIYKSWFEFTDQGAYRMSNTFGGGQTVTFTNKGQDQSPDESHVVYHADAWGNIKINDTEYKTSYATASCFYEVDNSKKS